MSSWAETIAHLFVSHRSRLEAFVARRSRDREAASDLVQESFARLLASGGTGSADSDTKMLYAVARNAAIDHGRMVARHGLVVVDDPADARDEAVPSAEGQIAARRALEALDAALDELPERTKDVFLLRRVYGYSHTEVAAALGIAVSTVEKHLTRAVRHCEARVRPHLHP
ncbi:MAG: RNA polymerase sigma factor [Nitrospirota bacterium]